MSYDTAPGISIHAAREGGDSVAPVVNPPIRKFQSTPPVKAATRVPIIYYTSLLLFQSTPPVKAATQDEQLQHVS